MLSADMLKDTHAQVQQELMLLPILAPQPVDHSQAAQALRMAPQVVQVMTASPQTTVPT